MRGAGRGLSHVSSIGERLVEGEYQKIHDWEVDPARCSALAVDPQRVVLLAERQPPVLREAGEERLAAPPASDAEGAALTT